MQLMDSNSAQICQVDKGFFDLQRANMHHWKDCRETKVNYLFFYIPDVSWLLSTEEKEVLISSHNGLNSNSVC